MELQSEEMREVEQRKLPIGIQSFEDLRKNHYIYVDKTKYVWNLINTGKTYFLSRPRRFGKSMLTSTIKAYFEGRKELFEGLAIERLENEKGKDAWQLIRFCIFPLPVGNIEQRMVCGKLWKSYSISMRKDMI